MFALGRVEYGCRAAITRVSTRGLYGRKHPGAAVNVPVTYTCGPGEIDFGYLYVELSQRTQQGRLAQGYGYTDENLVCDGTPHTVIVQVEADTYFGGVAFKSGVALADATLVVRLEGFTTEVESVQEEIRPRN